MSKVKNKEIRAGNPTYAPKEHPIDRKKSIHCHNFEYSKHALFFELVGLPVICHGPIIKQESEIEENENGTQNKKTSPFVCSHFLLLLWQYRHRICFKTKNILNLR